MKSNHYRAERIVEELLLDMQGRKGFRQQWDETDEETQHEWHETWFAKVLAILEEQS